MTISREDQFYTNLPVISSPLPELLLMKNMLADIPSSWHVIITDIRESTKAVLEGKHEQVNQIATGSIVAVLNVAYRLGINVPFFFGGDGATFIVPSVMIAAVMDSLFRYRSHTLDSFGLDLRTGTVPVKVIYNSGEQIQIAKFRSSSTFNIPVVLGNGLGYAEKLIKGREADFPGGFLPYGEPDLSGMQCRWDRISPPPGKAEILTLLVSAKNGSNQSETYAEILCRIEALYGPSTIRQPISVAGLKLKSTFKQLQKGAGQGLKKVKWTKIAYTWLNTLYCRLYFRTERGRSYLERLVEMSDTLVIDGRINTVISGTPSQRKELLLFLDQLEYSASIVYGSHISSASIMSCYVRDMDYSHIHFVDGAGGGYTQASRVLKRKMRWFGVTGNCSSVIF